MKILILYVYILMIIVTHFLNLLSAKDILLRNIDIAIFSNIVDRYGSQRTLNKTELKIFLHQVVQVEPSKKNSENETSSVVAIQDACVSAVNITFCRKTIAEQCLDSDVLLDLYADSHINSSWTDVFTAIVYQQLSKSCHDAQDGAGNKHGHSKTPEGMAWAYGLGFSFINCIISMSGGCMIPLMKFKVFKRILLYCVGLGVSILASAGCLVLLPEALELTGTNSPVPDYHFKMAIFLGAIYLFYLSHRLKKIWISTSENTSKKEPIVAVHVIAASDNMQIIPSETSPDIDQGLCELQDDLPDETNSTSSVTKDENSKKTKEVATTAWMLLIGDGFHKFIDGVSVGASFTETVFAGISVALAIICEELPHELGDIALLLQAGMDIKRALLYNLMAVIPSFLGVAIGIVLGENTHASTWILAIAGGMFVYIAFVDMLPELWEQAKELTETGTETSGKILFMQNLGLLTGFIIIFLLAMFGGEMEM